MIKDQPLVSLGLPTYNRPDLLFRALNSLTKQTYKNIDIIVSDNASTDPRVKEIVDGFAKHDKRIRYFRQETNIGPSKNFFFVLKQSAANYFMWVADDDLREPWVVEKCVKALVENSKYAAVMTEVQYMDEDKLKFEFFAEGKAFYLKEIDLTIEKRLEQTLDYNYGNLIYALFRRSALMNENEIFWETISYSSLNEIMPLLFSAVKGEYLVLPEIGLYKQVPRNVYEQAKWEMSGGWLFKVCRMKRLSDVVNTWRYHKLVFEEIASGIKFLPIDVVIQKSLTKRVRWNLFKHFVWMLIAFKPRFEDEYD
jgi:glycosyltransferase domain-containing protein